MMKRLFVLIAAASALTLRVQAQSPSTEAVRAPFGGGEELYYNVSYRAALIPNINLMTVSLRTFDENLGGTPHYHIVGHGTTNGSVMGLFELNDTYHCWIDASTLLPTRLTTDIRENNYRFRSTYNYSWDSMTVNTVRRNRRWDADRHATIPLKDNSGDAMSLFFRMRSIDTSTLVAGRDYPLELVLDEISRPIAYRFIGREEVKIKRVGTFRALRFTCTMATSDGSTFEEGMTFTIWISDDANHIPLKMESPVRIGRVGITLAPGFKTIHPMTSRVD